jgi:formiminotetrahydrofolate cyclodeaminase
MSFTQRIKDLTYQTPVTDYLKLRDEINADLNAVSQEDLNEFNDKFFTKYDMMKSKEWEKHEQEKKLSKYVYRTDR